ncbi:Unknown protein, partial [Striga hermonthica]
SCTGQDDELSQRLEGFSLSEKEHNYIDLGQVDIKLSDGECKRSLFGKIIGDRKASWIGVQRALNYIWKLREPMEARELGHNFFQFIFQNKEDLEKVNKGINWTFENQYLILSEWKTGLSMNHPIFQELQLWVQVFNVPLNWLSTDVGMKIGRVFKQVKNVVIVGAGSHGGRIMRLLAAVNLNEPLPRCAKLRLDDQEATVSFKYEKLVNHCHYCGWIGHLDRECSKRLEDIRSNTVKEGQFRDWMRATESRHWAGTNNAGSQSPPRATSASPPTPVNAPSSTFSQDNAINQLIPFPASSSPHNIQTSVASSSFHTSTQTTPKPIEKPPSTSLTIPEQTPPHQLPINIPQSSDMETEHAISKSQNKAMVSVQDLHKSIAKTWKRSSARTGRLQRQSDTHSLMESSSSGKRSRQEQTQIPE